MLGRQALATACGSDNPDRHIHVSTGPTDGGDPASGLVARLAGEPPATHLRPGLQCAQAQATPTPTQRQGQASLLQTQHLKLSATYSLLGAEHRAKFLFLKN